MSFKMHIHLLNPQGTNISQIEVNNAFVGVYFQPRVNMHLVI